MATVESLYSMGFDRALVDTAVAQAKGDANRALELLLAPDDIITPGNPAVGTGGTIPAAANPERAVVVHPDANDPKDVPPPLYSEPAGPVSASGEGPKPVAGAAGEGAAGGDRFEDDVDKAIQLSLLNSAKEIRDPTERVRVPGIPVGLKNVGNTCYFNTMLQSYFGIADFRNFILQIDIPDSPSDEEESSIVFLRELQRLFGFMLMTERKYSDPSKVIKAMLSNSNRVIGGQEDPTEYSVMFLEAVCEGIKAYRKKKTEFEKSGGLSSSEVSSFMERRFSAKQVERFEVTKLTGEVEERTQETEYNQVIVNISQGTLYKALEEYTSMVLFKDYLEDGYQSVARKYCMFKSFPPVLSVLVQRLSYDKEKNLAVKLNNPFQFPKVLYLDRFCVKNYPVISKRRDTIQGLEERKKELCDKLEHLQRYNGPVGVDEHLRQTCSYLEGKDIPLRDEIIGQLQSMLRDVEKEIAAYSSEVESIEQQVDHMFDDMRDISYRLHAVLVHDGTALGGHYWAFVYDVVKQVWFKHNDTTVQQVEEELMWEESTGGHGNTSAYCLIYVDTNLSEGDAPDSAVVSPELQADIADDNILLSKEIADWHANADQRERVAEQKRQTAELIQEVQGRLATLCTSTLDDNNDPRLLSFEHFLFHLGSQDVMQRFIVNQVFQARFPGETLELTTRMDTVIAITDELPGLIIHRSEADRKQEDLLIRQYERFKLVAEHTLSCFAEWMAGGLTTAAVHLVNAFKADWDVMYSMMRREAELYFFFEQLLMSMTVAAESRLRDGDWATGLDEGFSIVTLLAQRGKSASTVVKFLRRRWLQNVHRAETVLEYWVGRTTHPKVWKQHRQKLLEIKQMVNETREYANRYTFQVEVARVNWAGKYATLAEAYNALKREVQQRVREGPRPDESFQETPLGPPLLPGQGVGVAK
eukprot:TRINITY_DN5050_c0_g1_i4.p1 TRINITY_DN5050_c0_g1~~TRINITY_DN5050_c0_g1_i4.p1  ORF type:complete len:927 (+),score=215.52 TRINITY_DN5050_c0_g1_i4:370-3150(+)